MKKTIIASAFISLSLLCVQSIASATTQPVNAAAQCAKDTDCKGDRICESGKCQSPTSSISTTQIPPPAPAMQYKPLTITSESIGNVFHFSQRDLGGSAIDYIARSGVMNVMEQVVEDVEALTEGNKLTVKKEGSPSIFYNGIVKLKGENPCHSPAQDL
jgi:hypothetical protein